MSVKLNPTAPRPQQPTSAATPPPATKPELAPMPPVLGPNGELLGDDYGKKVDGFQQSAPKPAPMPPVAGNGTPQEKPLDPSTLPTYVPPELAPYADKPQAQTSPAPSTPPQAAPTPSTPPPQPQTTPRPAAPGSTPSVAPTLSLEKPTAPESLTVRSMRQVEPMAGGLVRGQGAVQQLNNNHPEIITTLKGGNVAVSTLSGTPTGLNHSFNGDFRIFSSNQNRTGGTLHQTVALHNPSDKPVTVKVNTWASTTTAEAPYRDTQKNPDGTAFKNRETLQQGVQPNGPGQLNAARILRGDNELPQQSRTLTIPPGGTVTLPSSAVRNGNELITQGDLHSNGPVQVGIVYNSSPPTTEQVKQQLQTGKSLATSHHDKVPTPLDAPGSIIFGRVAGVAESSSYRGVMSNSQDHSRYLVTGSGEQSFAFNTKRGTDLGTGRNEASRMIARNGNASYESPLNYGAEFSMGGAFHNPTNQPKRVQLFLDSPVSSNDSRVMRGTFEVKLRTSEQGQPQTKYVTVSQTQQTRGKESLLEFTLPPGASYQVDLRTIYGANNTGPQSIRVVTSEAQ